MRWLFVLAISVFTLASVGCAASGSFAVLIAWRVLQGFSGGTLIPAVFAAVFLLFPLARQGARDHVRRRAGGARADRRTGRRRLDHRDLFLALAVPDQCRARHRLARSSPASCCRGRRCGSGEARKLDVLSLLLLAIALAALEIALKQAPARGWSSGLVIGPAGVQPSPARSASSGARSARRARSSISRLSPTGASRSAAFSASSSGSACSAPSI